MTRVLKMLLALSMLWFNQPVASGQSDSIKSEVKLSKTDRIWLTAYDDTTKALAKLFILKRGKISKNVQTSFVVGGISIASFGLGALMLQGLNDPAGTYNIVNYIGIPVAIIGATGVLISVASLGIHWIRLNPYTLKKYKRLIEMHKSGKPLPEFYVIKLPEYLR